MYVNYIIKKSKKIKQTIENNKYKVTKYNNLKMKYNKKNKKIKLRIKKQIIKIFLPTLLKEHLAIN